MNSVLLCLSLTVLAKKAAIDLAHFVKTAMHCSAIPYAWTVPIILDK